VVEQMSPCSAPADDTSGPMPGWVTAFTAQDWLLIVEALATCAGPPPRKEGSSRRANGALTSPRTQRAWELVDAIVAAIDLSPDEIADRIDDDWRGHGSSLDLDSRREDSERSGECL